MNFKRNETQRILIDSFTKASGMDFKGFPASRIVSNDFNSAIERGNSFNLFPPNQRVLSDSIPPGSQKKKIGIMIVKMMEEVQVPMPNKKAIPAR